MKTFLDYLDEELLFLKKRKDKYETAILASKLEVRKMNDFRNKNFSKIEYEDSIEQIDKDTIVLSEIEGSIKTLEKVKHEYERQIQD